jgi:hypothetical protein
MIHRVERTSDGWRAGVEVHLRARNLEGGMVHLFNRHLEVYACHGGVVLLQSESVDPVRAPNGELGGAIS